MKYIIAEPIPRSMNPCIPSKKGMGEKCRLALKAEAEVQDGEELLWELIEYRYNMQKMVDELWEMKDVPGRGQLHLMFNEWLTKECHYRGQVARNMYNRAGKIVVKSALKSGARHTPILKRLIAFRNS